jgi:hypothetical protein
MTTSQTFLVLMAIALLLVLGLTPASILGEIIVVLVGATLFKGK